MHTQSLHIDLHIDSGDIKALMLLIIADYVFSELSYDGGAGCGLQVVQNGGAATRPPHTSIHRWDITYIF